MSNNLTPSEARFVAALCKSGPLGIAPLGLARALGVTSATVGNLSVIVEGKGFCTRERYGMRVFLRPTPAALAFAASNAAETSRAEMCAISAPVKKTRTPRQRPSR